MSARAKSNADERSREEHCRAEPGLPRDGDCHSVDAHDLFTGQRWVWQRDVYVRLGPEVEPLHVVSLGGLG